MRPPNRDRDRDDLLSAYQRELDYLLSAGARFQADHAGVGVHLQVDRLRDDDPHVARLLEGFAFLTARVRAKLDDEFPEITDAFLEVLHPHLLRPFPSSAIVQFARRAAVAPPEGGETIPAGTPLRARHHDYRACRFRTVYPVTLWPLAVEGAEFLADRLPTADRRPGDVALLRLTLGADAPGGFTHLGIDRLRFHLAGEDRVAFALHALLGSAVNRVEVRATPPVSATSHAHPGAGRVVLPARAIQPVGFDPGEGLIPYPRRVPRGYRFVQEYTHFPHKFLFFDLRLDLAALPPASTGCEILIFLNRTPRDPIEVEARHVRLGCTPVVNLFAATATPIRLTRTKRHYPVVPNEPGRTEVYAVDRVTGARADRDEPILYRPLFTYRPGEGDRATPYWHAHRRRPDDLEANRSGVDLAFGGEDFDPFAPLSDEIVSVAFTATNGDGAFGMPTGQPGGDFEPEGAVACGAVRCVLPPTRSHRPPTGRGAQWRLIANLALNYLSLAPVTRPGAAGPATGSGPLPDEDDRPHAARDALVDLLSIAIPPGDRSAADRIAGIASVASRQVFGPAPGGRGAVGGIEVRIQFDEAKFPAQTSYLLASVLDQFLGLHVAINSFSQLVVVDEVGQVVRRWPARAGERPLL